jgi:hypothetical protein
MALTATHGAAVRSLSLLFLCISVPSFSIILVEKSDVQGSSDKDVERSASFQDDFGPFTDPISWLKFTEAQLFPASIDATFPIRPLLRIFTTPFDFDTYKLAPCARQDVAKCMLHGTVTRISKQ